MEKVLHESPRSHQIARTRWRLCDLAPCIPWLNGCASGSVWHQLHILGFTRKNVTGFHVSPDWAYDCKWRRILAAYREALTAPQSCRMAWFDEMTYLRVPSLKPVYQQSGPTNEQILLPVMSNTQTRIAAAIDTFDGVVDSIQRSQITVTVLRNWVPEWAANMRTRWPALEQIYLVMDNWPVHHHSDFVERAEQVGVTLLFLPTYASWLNPIEKLWRWLRQDVIHSHPHAADLPRLRAEVTDWLALRNQPDPCTLFRTGLLSQDELAEIQAQPSPICAG